MHLQTWSPWSPKVLAMAKVPPSRISFSENLGGSSRSVGTESLGIPRTKWLYNAIKINLNEPLAKYLAKFFVGGFFMVFLYIPEHMYILYIYIFLNTFIIFWVICITFFQHGVFCYFGGLSRGPLKKWCVSKPGSVRGKPNAMNHPNITI